MAKERKCVLENNSAVGPGSCEWTIIVASMFIMCAERFLSMSSSALTNNPMNCSSPQVTDGETEVQGDR